MHTLLKLVHHKHTGKQVHHHHTSYRALAVLILLTGAFVMFFQHTTHAANSTVVSQSIEAAPPINPAVILKPVDGAKVSKEEVVVEGTCDFILPVSIVSIYRNGSTFLGSGPCNPDGTFSFYITLSPGLNILTARTSNIGGGYGPLSEPVRVTYTPPPPSSGSGSPGVSSGLIMRSRMPYVLFGLNTPAVWTGSFSGGTPPYSLTIDWGDGTIEQKTGILRNKEYSFKHEYSEMKPHFLVIRMTDSKGLSREYTFAAVTPIVQRSIDSLGAMPSKPFFETMPGFYIGIYMCYLLALIIFVLAWYDTHRNRRQLAPIGVSRIPLARKNMKAKQRSNRKWR